MELTPGINPCAASDASASNCVSAGRAVGDAGIFVNDFEGGEEPDFSFLERPAERANVVLPGERLLGVGRGIVDGKARIQSCGPLVKRRVSVPTGRCRAW